MGKIERSWAKLQTSSLKMINSGDLMYGIVMMVSNTVLYLEFTENILVIKLCDLRDVLAKAILVIIFVIYKCIKSTCTS